MSYPTLVERDLICYSGAWLAYMTLSSNQSLVYIGLCHNMQAQQFPSQIPNLISHLKLNEKVPCMGRKPLCFLVAGNIGLLKVILLFQDFVTDLELIAVSFVMIMHAINQMPSSVPIYHNLWASIIHAPANLSYAAM